MDKGGAADAGRPARRGRAVRFFDFLASGAQATLKLALLAGAVLLFVPLLQAALKPGLMIESIEIPESLTQRGYTSPVVARRISDAIAEINATAGTRKIRNLTGLMTVESTTPEIVVPVGTFSTDVVVRQLRRALGQKDSRIFGEITTELPATAQAGAPKAKAAASSEAEEEEATEAPTLYAVTLRSGDGRISPRPSPPTSSVDALIRNAALRILERYDPYVAANYFYTIKDETNVQRLISICLTNDTPDDDPWAKNLQGSILNEWVKDHKQAERVYRATLKDHPDFPIARTYLAYSLELQGRYEEALAEASKAAQDFPEYARTYIVMGSVFQKQKTYSQAIAMFQKAIQIEPKAARGYLRLQQVHGEQGKPEQALATIEDGLRKAPEQDDLHLARSRLLQQAGDIGAARAAAELALQLNERKPETYLLLADMHSRDGNTASALTVLQSGLDKLPSDAGLLRALKENAMLAERLPVAAVAAKRLTELEPQVAAHHLKYAIVLLRQNKARQARIAFQRAASLNSGLQGEISELLAAAKQPPLTAKAR